MYIAKQLTSNKIIYISEYKYLTSCFSTLKIKEFTCAYSKKKNTMNHVEKIK